jgi:hypothetical protein
MNDDYIHLMLPGDGLQATHQLFKKTAGDKPGDYSNCAAV